MTESYVSRAVVLIIAGLLLAAPAAAGADSRPFSFGLGAGIVDNGNDEEPYFEASFRLPLRRNARGGIFRPFLEAEIGFWDFAQPFGSDDRFEGEVLNLGINFLALAPGRVVDVWVGIGVGVYLEDFEIIGGNVGTVRDESETALGGNLQVGIDFNVAAGFAIFAVGRIDLVDTDFFDEQQKLYAGLRFRLGGD